MTSGSSGEPKLRQSVTASGRRAGDADVAVGLGERELRAGVGVELGEAAVAVGRDRDAEAGLLVDADHAGVLGLGEDRVAQDVAVVLVGDPRLVGEVGRRRPAQQLVAELVAGRRPGEPCRRRRPAARRASRARDRALVHRAVVRDRCAAARRRRSRRASRSTRRPPSVTSPMTMASTSHLPQIARNASSCSARRPPSCAPATRS